MTLNKRVFRDFKFNFFRYISLFLLLAIGLGVISGMASSVDSILKSNSGYYEEMNIEDGNFSLMVPLTAEQIDKIIEMGVQIEELFFADMPVKDGSELRVYKVRSDIDKIKLIEGNLPNNKSEIVLEKLYAQKKEYKTGDSVVLEGREYVISGIGTVPDYNFLLKNITDIAKNEEHFSVAFIAEDAFTDVMEQQRENIEYYYAYRLSDELTDDEFKYYLQSVTFDKTEVSDKYVKELIDEKEKPIDDVKEALTNLGSGASKLESNIALTQNESLTQGATKLKDGIIELQEAVDRYVDEKLEIEYDNLKTFLPKIDNIRINNYAEDAKVNKAVAIVAGIFFLVLVSYILSVFSAQNIERERAVIGTLYSLGYQKSEMIRSFIILPLVVVFLGSVFGVGLGYFMIEPLAAENLKTFSYPGLQRIFEPYILIIALIAPMIFTLVINYLIINKKLSKPPLTLLRKQVDKDYLSNLSLDGFKFKNRYIVRQLLKEIRVSIVLFVGLFLAVLIMIMGYSVKGSIDYYIEKTKEDVKYEYMYIFNYPPNTIPQDGEAGYTKDFKIDYPMIDGTANVTLQGVCDESKYFKFNVDVGKNEVYISSSAAEKLGLAVGDRIYLIDSVTDESFGFDVKGVVTYTTGLYMFMNIEAMRERFDQEEEYYNTCFSNVKLDVDGGRVQSIVSRDDINAATNKFVDQMAGTILLLVGLSVLILVITMYLLIQLMLERAAFSISLVKILGYKPSEIRKIYLTPGGWTVFVSSIISVPIAKLIMNEIFPMLITNFSSGMKVYIYPQMYIEIFGLIAITYLVIRFIMHWSLSKISLVEILKSVE